MFLYFFLSIRLGGEAHSFKYYYYQAYLVYKKFLSLNLLILIIQNLKLYNNLWVNLTCGESVT